MTTIAERLSAIATHNAQLKAFTYVDAAGVAQSAASLAARHRTGQAPKTLEGVSVSIKANVAVKGWPHTAGLRFRAANVATEDAYIVTLLRNAGAILLGATNMDEGALGAEGANPWYGTTQNPHRDGYSAGGSSSGAACAVAAGLCELSIGTDTIGSVRIPAAFCGVAGLKPTFGLLSTRGLLPVHRRFDHMGLIAKRCTDIARGLEVVRGYDAECNVSLPIDLRPPRASGTPLNIGCAVGLTRVAISDEVVAAYNAGIAALRTLGHTLVPVDLDRWDLARVRRAVLSLCELEMWRVHRERINQFPDDFSDGLRAFIRFGGRLTTEDIADAEARIAKFFGEWQAVMSSFDVFVCPTTACTSFRHGERPPHNTADLTAIASATGLPALSLPLPVAAGALPAALQLLGPAASDRELLRLGSELEMCFSAPAR